MISDSPGLPGLKTIQPKVFYDFRGEFVCTYSADEYNFVDGHGQPIQFVEDDISVSRKNVLRGLHGDANTWKLVQCLHGEVYLVVADMRSESAAHLRWQAFTLNERNRTQVLVPAGCATGLLCVSETCIFSYKQSTKYRDASRQFSIRWDDSRLNVYWPVSFPVLSLRDSSGPVSSNQRSDTM